MDMNNRNYPGFLEKVTGPLGYAWTNDPATYSTTTYIVVLRKEPLYFTMTPIEQVRLILNFFGFSL